MKIIGIHDGINSAICLLIDGKIKGLLQEERLAYEKNYNGFPDNSLKKILKINKLNYNDIDYYVYNFNHLGYPTDKNGLLDSYRTNHTKRVKIKELVKKTFVYNIFKTKRKNNRIEYLLSKGVSKEKIKFVEHHLAHASAAYFGCPWAGRDEKVLILTQDGSGDGISGTVNIGYQGKIERIAAIKKEDSLGRLYAITTFMMGMVPLEHEYKLMGMAPFAPKSGLEIAYSVYKDLLQFSNGNPLIWRRKKGLPPVQMLYPYLRKKTELLRFDWIAAGIQKFTEEMLIKWVENCIAATGIKKLVLSGGTFMNVKANQMIGELPDVENLFIFPSCGDESNSIGAAYHYHYKINPNAPFVGLDHLYHGPDETNKENCLLHIMNLEEKNTIKFKYEYFSNIEYEVSKLLAKGEIVARCKGPLEFGARALGNRSILSDPSDLHKITEINNMIKKRDFWMPFAPVILKERSLEYIKNPKNIDASYMIITFDSTEKYKDFIGGIQQIDLTARPQVIDENSNSDYYTILKGYEKITGKGVLINTSFNLHGLPIVYGPKEALHVFENSGLEYLALGNYLVKKTN